MTMQDLVGWLREVEYLASTVYRAAADVCDEHSEQGAFLRRLAEDEVWHYHLMGSAAEILREQEHVPVPAILVDDAAKAHVEAPLRGLRDQIRDHGATEKDILEALVKSETSEWNDIFLYVIATCAELSTAFQYVAASVQKHECRIEQYIESVSDNPEFGGVLSSLPQIWTDRILVVEDNEAVRQLLKRLLSRLGEVTTAEDGEAGLQAIDEQFFNVIVTDVDMPKLDGISMMEQACERQPHLKALFIICTGDLTDRVADAAVKHGVPVLEKPVAISVMSAEVLSVLNKAL